MSGPEPTRPQRPLRNRLNFLLFLSHALVFGAILLSVVLPTGKIADIFLQVSLGAVLAGLFGLIFTINLQRGLEEADIALERLSRGDVAAPIKPRWPLNGLINSINLLSGQVNQQAHRVRQVEQVRGRWLEQISEAAAQEERNRLARDLHDSIKQQLFSIVVSAATAQARWDNDPEGARQALSDVRRNTQEAQVEMKALLQQLAPAPLEKVGLIVALRDQCEALQYRTGAQVSAELDDLPPDDLLPPGAQETIFRLVQEGLSNVARHARASNVLLRLYRHSHQGNDWLLLDIADNGQGFDPQTQENGMGLGNMQGRAQQLGGTLEIKSAPGKGAFLRAWIPLAKPVAPQIEESDPPEVQRVEKRVKRVINITIALEIMAFLGIYGIWGINYIWSSSPERENLINPILALLFITLASGPIVFVLWYIEQSIKKIVRISRPNSRGELKLRERQAGVIAGLGILSVWLLPILPLSWTEWEGSRYLALALEVGGWLLAVYLSIRSARVTHQIYPLLPLSERYKQYQEDQKLVKLLPFLFILWSFTAFMIFFTLDITAFPVTTPFDWMRLTWLWLAPLQLISSLASFWYIQERKRGRPFGPNVRLAVKLVAGMIATGLIMLFILTTSKFTVLASFKMGSTDFQSVAWSPDGKTLAAMSYYENKIYLLDSNGKLKVIITSPDNSGGSQRAVAWSPDGKILATSWNSARIFLWSPEGKAVRALEGGKDTRFTSLSWSPDGKKLAAGASDNKIWWWSMPDGKLVNTLSGHTDIILSVAWSPDGKFLASGSKDNTVRLWTAEGKEVNILKGHTAQVNTVAWSPDSKILASGSGEAYDEAWAKDDATIRLWGADGRAIAILQGHNGRVNQIAWSPDSKRLISASSDNSLRLWSAEGKELSKYSIRWGAFNSVAWSSDVKRVAAGSRPSDKALLIFKIED